MRKEKLSTNMRVSTHIQIAPTVTETKQVPPPLQLSNARRLINQKKGITSSSTLLIPRSGFGDCLMSFHFGLRTDLFLRATEVV